MLSEDTYTFVQRVELRNIMYVENTKKVTSSESDVTFSLPIVDYHSIN